MKVAVVGCAHGELDKIYSSIRHLEEAEKIRVDFVICCGDFQAVRNYGDLNCMAVPRAYRQLNTFYKYYSGELRAPYFTLFVGGNHEASNFLAELPYGGWVAPRIYYMGHANVVQIGDLRIAGLSGIYKANDYLKGHFECPPYNEDTKRSTYHVRQMDVFRLKQLKPNSLDIFISHDWPRGIHAYGNEQQLFRTKPYFRDEAMQGILGNPSTEDLLFLLKPKYWFSAHMHVKFPAIVEHEGGGQTKFLALDKCLPRREFMQVLDIGCEGPPELELKYDLEWLTILKSANHLCSTSNRIQYMPGPTPGNTIRYQFTPTEEEMNEVAAILDQDLTVPLNFRWTAPPLFQIDSEAGYTNQQKFYINPQTQELCGKLGITNTNELLAKLRPMAVEEAYYLKCEQGSASGGSVVDADGGSVLGGDGSSYLEKSESGILTTSSRLKRLEEEVPADTYLESTEGNDPSCSSALESTEGENPDEILLDDEDGAKLDSSFGKKSTGMILDVASEEGCVDQAESGVDSGRHQDRKRSFDMLESGVCKNEPETESEGLTITPTTADASSNVLAKFKRRNAEMYASNDDDASCE